MPMPFALVENEWFRNLTGLTISRKTISQTMANARGTVNGMVKEILAKMNPIALVVDEWTDCSQASYLGIELLAFGLTGYTRFCLAHWSLDGELDGSAQTLADDIRVVGDWFLGEKWAGTKCKYMVSDTTAVMPATARELKMNWMPCFAHVFNLMLVGIVDSVKVKFLRIIDLPKVLNKSTKWRKVEKYSRYCTVAKWCKTRWYSMHRLLVHAIALQEAINEFFEEQGIDLIPETQWAWAKAMLPILTVFRQAIEKLETDEFGSLAHVYPCYVFVNLAVKAFVSPEGQIQQNQQIRAWEDCLSGPWRKNFSEEVENQVRLAGMLHLGVDLHCVAQILPENEKEAFMNENQEMVRQAYLQQEIPTQRQLGERPNEVVGNESFLAMVYPRDDGPEGGHRGEVESFLCLPRCPREEKFDVQIWWTDHKDIYPGLFNIAQRVLGIPATSACVERQFSKAQRLKPLSRWSLNPIKLGAMVCFSENMNAFDAMYKTWDEVRKGVRNLDAEPNEKLLGPNVPFRTRILH
jgi:hypothetical protein